MKQFFYFFLSVVLMAAFTVSSTAQTIGTDPNPNEGYYRDIYPDTWVATDAVGRNMPLHSEVGDRKKDKDRKVGIFYITWHGQGLGQGDGTYEKDVTKILEEDPSVRFDSKHPLWGKGGGFHWGEPEMDYFLSQDEWVIRKDLSMLADAGVDVLIMDVTNAVLYWDEWELLFNTMRDMREKGNQVPQFCFWAFNGPVMSYVQELYDRIYKAKQFEELWFHWEGKPLLLYNGKPAYVAHGEGVKHPNPHYDAAAATDPSHPHYGDPDYANEFYTDYSKEVKNFFTLRTMWWGYYEWGGERFVGTEDNWSFGYDLDDPQVRNMDPIELLSTHKGRREQAAVTPAQHPISMMPVKPPYGVGKSWSREHGVPKAFDEQDMPVSAYVPWLGKEVENPEHYGIYFQERWDEAVASDPDFLYINDWNEWSAGKYDQGPEGLTFMDRPNSPYVFIDQYNAEFNRCIHPMKGGYTDNYYMQMAQNLRRYKGSRPIPELKGYQSVPMQFMQGWDKVKVEYRDTKGDIFHRNALGYGGKQYVNNSGRNDIITSKVAIDKKNLYFYCETTDPLTPYTDNNWMLLVIDADNNSETGWYGYDYIINKSVKNENETTLMKYLNGEWKEVCELKYNAVGNRLEIAVPRKQLGLTGKKFVFDFKWSDNAESLDDPISFCLNGDTAPNRRFNYRCIWGK